MLARRVTSVSLKYCSLTPIGSFHIQRCTARIKAHNSITSNVEEVISSQQYLIRLLSSFSASDVQKNLKRIANERNENLYQQDLHRTDIVIQGIPTDIPTELLKKELINLMNSISAPIRGEDVLNVRRVNSAGKIVCKFNTEENVRQVMMCVSKLKSITLYGDSRLYIRWHLCPEFEKISYYLRKARSQGLIADKRIYSGRNQVKRKIGGKFEDVTHRVDLLDIGIQLEERDRCIDVTS